MPARYRATESQWPVSRGWAGVQEAAARRRKVKVRIFFIGDLFRSEHSWSICTWFAALLFFAHKKRDCLHFDSELPNFLISRKESERSRDLGALHARGKSGAVDNSWSDVIEYGAGGKGNSKGVGSRGTATASPITANRHAIDPGSSQRCYQG